MADTVLYEVSDGLATITLNRPEAMNALNIAAKVALRDAAASRRPPTTPYGPCCSPRTGTGLLRGPGPQGAHRAARRRPRVRQRRRHEHGRGALQPDRAGAHRDAEAGRGRGQRRRGRGGLRLRARRGLPGRRRHRRLQHVLRGGRADRRLGRLLDAAPADRPEPRRRPAALPAHRSPRRRRTSWASRTRSCPPAELRAEAAAVARALAEGPTVAYAAIKESLAYGAGALARRDAGEGGRAPDAGGRVARTTRSRCEAFVTKEKPKYLGR